MKKFYLYLLMLPALLLTSCGETDEMIADRLCGVNWEGALDTYYSNRWGEAFLDGEYHTVWRFEADYYDNYGVATHGTGYEADYSVYDRRDYAYSPFYWEIRGGNIYITYRNSDWNDIRIDWRDYSISYNYFRGTMYDWENRIYHFDLVSNGSWSWDPYWSRTRAASPEADPSVPFYVGEDGQSCASGKFAEALMNKKKASR